MALGSSWQVVLPDLRTSENVVFWRQLGLRMVGRAEISSFTEPNTNLPGYSLVIKGLEFRYGESGVPEADFKRYMAMSELKSIKVIDLGDKQLR